MGFLKKLYGESQKVRHSGSLGKDIHGLGNRGRQAQARREAAVRSIGKNVMENPVHYNSPSRPGNRGFGITKMKW